MKFKALALSLLLILPIIAAFAPKTEAVNQPALWVFPKEKTFYGPCIVSTEFEIQVFLFNNKDMTGYGVYAYDFFLNWDPTKGISLVSATPIFPWPEGEYYVIANEFDNTLGYYHLAVTALGTQEEGELTNVQTSLVKLKFHIDEEPCWPTNYCMLFDLNNTKLSTGCGQPIPAVEEDDGKYCLYSSQPDVHLSPEGPIEAKCICHSYVVEVHVSNVTNAYGFGLYLAWDPDFLETSIQKISLCPSFAPPYEWLVQDLGDGYLCLEVWKPCEKPPICSKDTCVFSIEFHAISPQLGVVPFDVDTAIHVEYAYVISKCPETRYYDTFGDLLYWGDVEYLWRPLRADLNLDCIVDIEDLSALAEYYGVAHPWSDLNAPNAPAPVDIYDFVYIGKHYGEDP